MTPVAWPQTEIFNHEDANQQQQQSQVVSLPYRDCLEEAGVRVRVQNRLVKDQMSPADRGDEAGLTGLASCLRVD